MKLTTFSIILYSENRHATANFLSNLFDIEPVDSETGYTLLKNVTFSIKIFDGVFNRGSDIIEFHLSDKVALESMCNRVKFAHYRFSESMVLDDDLESKIELGATANSFDFLDIDGRKWRFLVES